MTYNDDNSPFPLTSAIRVKILQHTLQLLTLGFMHAKLVGTAQVANFRDDIHLIHPDLTSLTLSPHPQDNFTARLCTQFMTPHANPTIKYDEGKQESILQLLCSFCNMKETSWVTPLMPQLQWLVQTAGELDPQAGACVSKWRGAGDAEDTQADRQVLFGNLFFLCGMCRMRFVWFAMTQFCRVLSGLSSSSENSRFPLKRVLENLNSFW